MKMPSATWGLNYKADKRSHNHRCVCCNKIVAEGEFVIMARVAGDQTKVMHEPCADKPYGGSPQTGRDILEIWGMQYLAGCGYREAKKFLEKRRA